MSKISIIIRSKNDQALNKNIESILNQNFKECAVFVIDYGVEKKSMIDFKNRLNGLGIDFHIIPESADWASDLNNIIASVNTPYTIICEEGTEWSPDYLNISINDFHSVDKKYDNISAYVSRGTKNRGYYTRGAFRGAGIHHIEPFLSEGIINIKDMIFYPQFMLSQAIFKTDFIKNIEFNKELGKFSYWDFLLQLIFKGNVYSTNQQHIFIHADVDTASQPWPQSDIFYEHDPDAEKIFRNHIFRSAWGKGLSIYHLVHTAIDKLNHQDGRINGILHSTQTVEAKINARPFRFLKKKGKILKFLRHPRLGKPQKIFKSLSKFTRKIFKNAA